MQAQGMRWTHCDRAQSPWAWCVGRCQQRSSGLRCRAGTTVAHARPNQSADARLVRSVELLKLRIEPLHGRELVRAEAHNLVVSVRAEGKGDTVVVQARKTLDPRMAAMLIVEAAKLLCHSLALRRRERAQRLDASSGAKHIYTVKFKAKNI